MSTPFLGEVRLFPYTFAPEGWADCDGHLLAIAQNDALFALLGTTYGGDGQSTFGLPDLRGRVPLHQGHGAGLSPRVTGETGGRESVTLSTAQIPAHSHGWSATSAPVNAATPATGNQLGTLSDDSFYTGDITGLADFVMADTMLSSSGGRQAHDNLMPTLTVRFCMALEGIFPSRS